MASRKLEDRIHELKQFRGTSAGDGIDPIIRKALTDPDAWVRGQAANAQSDIEIYAPRVAALLVGRRGRT